MIKYIINRGDRPTAHTWRSEIANYDVDFSYSKVGTPEEVDTHCVMYSVLGVPENLEGAALLDYIEAHLRRSIPGHRNYRRPAHPGLSHSESAAFRRRNFTVSFNGRQQCTQTTS